MVDACALLRGAAEPFEPPPGDWRLERGHVLRWRACARECSPDQTTRRDETAEQRSEPPESQQSAGEPAHRTGRGRRAKHAVQSPRQAPRRPQASATTVKDSPEAGRGAGTAGPGALAFRGPATRRQPAWA
jgi:hypothetical protein